MAGRCRHCRGSRRRRPAGRWRWPAASANGRASPAHASPLDGVIQDPGGFGETDDGGWGNPYFTADAQQNALEHLRAADYFLTGRVTYELLHKTSGVVSLTYVPAGRD